VQHLYDAQARFKGEKEVNKSLATPFRVMIFTKKAKTAQSTQVFYQNS
jgi:hypothetical protein